MTISWWNIHYSGDDPNTFVPYSGYKETQYPNAPQLFVQTSFVDPDTDGDGVPDGDDDQDHDGYPNWFEVARPDGSAQFGGERWWETYTSLKVFPYSLSSGHDDRQARVQPYNPCKPTSSEACHAFPPPNYYDKNEDWESDTPDTWVPVLPPKY
jgi:hypothetical protein